MNECWQLLHSGAAAGEELLQSALAVAPRAAQFLGQQGEDGVGAAQRHAVNHHLLHALQQILRGTMEGERGQFN